MASRKKKNDDLDERVSRLSYGEAKERLNEILDALDREEVDLDDLAERVREAAALLRHLHGKLVRTRSDVEQVLQEIAEFADVEAENEEEGDDQEDALPF